MLLTEFELSDLICCEFLSELQRLLPKHLVTDVALRD